MEPEVDEKELVGRCLAHEEAALRILQRDYVKRAASALAALGLQASDRDEVLQQLFERLVLGENPRLAQYEGRGGLFGFVRAIAVRLALDLKRARTTATGESDDALLGIADGGIGPELALDKRISRTQFREAFHAAIEGLSPTQRMLLRQVYLDGLSNDAIGHLHGAHRATVFRWLVEARRDLSKSLRAELAARTGVPVAEIPPFAAFVRSELSLSLSRVLK